MDKRQIFSSLAAAVRSGEMAFPTSARVALKLRQALEDPGCHVDAATRLVEAEPLLAARVVATANAVAFNRSGREVAGVRSAVARLGFSTVRALAMALLTRQMAGRAASAATAALAAQLWDHTAHVASLTHLLARRVTGVDAETAMFAGIVHEVGGFYLLSRADEFPGLLDGGFAEWNDGGEAAVGAAVLQVLVVPEAVRTAIEAYWAGYLTMPPQSLGDTLLLAEELAPVASPLRALGDAPVTETSTASIDMVVGEATLTGILQESAAEVESLTAALRF